MARFDKGCILAGPFSDWDRHGGVNRIKGSVEDIGFGSLSSASPDEEIWLLRRSS